MPRLTITVAELTPQPYRFGLDRQIITIGRSKDSDIVIDCGSISQKHAAVYRLEGGYELRDEDSTNGIKLDGHRVEMISLKNGLSILLGNVALDFQLSSTELAALELEKPLKIQAIGSDDDEESEETKKLNAPEKKSSEERSSSKTTSRRDDSEEKAPARMPSRSGSGIGLFALLLILAAFAVGMAIRYQKDTGNSLIDALKARFSGQAVESVSPPVEDSKPADP